MEFTLPEMISQGLHEKDKIIVEMLPEIFTEELIRSPESKVKTESEDYVFEHQLVKQASHELNYAIEQTKEAIRAAMFGFISSNAILSLFFSQALQLLWAAINTLQMIVLTVLFSVSMPVNA